MDKKSFITKLNTIFCEDNQQHGKYSEVWLSDVDFGGMYSNGKFVLNVKAEHTIEDCNGEIFAVIKMLSEKASEELTSIWRVVVYNSNDSWHCYSVEDDILIYTQADACL